MTAAQLDPTQKRFLLHLRMQFWSTCSIRTEDALVAKAIIKPCWWSVSLCQNWFQPDLISTRTVLNQILQHLTQKKTSVFRMRFSAFVRNGALRRKIQVRVGLLIFGPGSPDPNSASVPDSKCHDELTKPMEEFLRHWNLTNDLWAESIALETNWSCFGATKWDWQLCHTWSAT